MKRNPVKNLINCWLKALGKSKINNIETRFSALWQAKALICQFLNIATQIFFTEKIKAEMCENSFLT